MLMLIPRLSSLAHKLLMLMFMPMLAGDIKRFVSKALASHSRVVDNVGT